MNTSVHTTHAPAAIGPYAQAVKAGNFLYISGQLPVDPVSGQVVEGITEATHQVMKNLDAILKEAGFSFSDVVKSTIFLIDMGDFSAMNEVYGSYLDPEQLPARETVQVAGLPKSVEVEISMIAYRG